MDMVRLARAASSFMTRIGFSFVVTSLFSGVLLFGILGNSIDSFSLILIVFLFLFGCILSVVGGIYWIQFQLTEHHFLRKYGISTTPRIFDDHVNGLIGNGGSLQPAFLIDSVDREILEIISTNSGDILAVKNQLKIKALLLYSKSIAQRILNLIDLGMVELYRRRITRTLFLTPLGHEAIRTPSAVFSSKIPIEVRQYMYEVRRQLLIENWGQVVLESHKAIESAYKQIIRGNASTNPDAVTLVEEIERKRTTAGRLHQMLEQLKVLKANSFERGLSNKITQLRPASHDSDDARVFTSEDAIRCEQYLGILMRILFN